MTLALSPEHTKEFDTILSRYPNKMAACIPVLHLVQDAGGGSLTDEGIAFVADKLDLPTSHVLGVATFYSLFNLEPVGEHQVWVCRTLSCALSGAEDILAHCEKRLGIHPGQTTEDGKVTLWTAECLAACGAGPMMQVDKAYHENLTKDDVDVILDRLVRD
jgi:NADH-quinone oxidoreductase subunit E